MKGHEEYRELLALSAIEADCEERRALEAHLALCAECRAEQRELRDAAAALALDVEPVAPSPQLRTRLLESIKTTPQESPAGAPGAASRVAPPTTSRVAPSTSAGRGHDGDGVKVVSLEGERARREDERVRRESASGLRADFGRRGFAYGAVAASLLLCALAAASFVLWQRNTAMKSEVASLSASLNRTLGELSARDAELERARRERELLASPDARTADLAGTRAAQSARARLVFDARTGEAMLTATNLPPAPAGRAYQLWFIADGKPLPGSVFTTDAAGRGEMHAQVPPEGRRAQVFAVTVEPAGGAQSPTGEIVLKGAP